MARPLSDGFRALLARNGKSWAVDGVHEASERYTLKQPRKLLWDKELSAEEAAARLAAGQPVSVERQLEVRYDEAVRLSRQDAVQLTSDQQAQDYVARFGHQEVPRDIYHVEGQPVHPARYQQANFLDGNADFEITRAEILAETRPAKLSFEESALLDYQIHDLTRTVPKQVAEYRSYDQYVAEMKELATKYPDDCHLISLGKSREGRELLALQMGKGPIGAVLSGLSHAREWASGEPPLEVAKAVLHDERELLEQLTVVILPVINPDGYQASRTEDPTLRGNSARVDLNRQYPVNYRLAGDTPESSRDDKGGSDEPGKPTFRGSGPLSEPEARAVAELMHLPGLKGWLDFHGYGRLLICPDSQRQAEYEELLAELNVGLGYKETRLSDYGAATGTLNDFGESLGVLTVTAEIGLAFQPAGEAHQQTRQNGLQTGLRFLRRMAANSKSEQHLQG